MKRAGGDPPYLQIVAELRRRIAAGELAAGAALPPVRQIARDFGVALATATKAVATLSHHGLVKAVPRVGTVVTSKLRASAGGRDAELSRERIVDAAIAMADREGIAALSVRGVASKLDIPTMSLYRHVRSKDELVQRMIEAAIGAPFPVEPPAGWRAQLELGARLQWQVYRRHPWLARVMIVTRPLPLPNTLAHAEWMLRALDGLGLDAATMLQLHIAVHSYIQGLAVNLEAEAQAENDTGMSEADWMASHEAAFIGLAASGRLPTFAKVLAALSGGFDLDLDALFELGLRALLDGVTARIAAT